MAEQISNFIIENPTVFGIIFVAVCIIILVPLIIFGIKNHAKKKNMLKENENLVEIIFDSPLLTPHPLGAFAESSNNGFTLYSVNEFLQSINTFSTGGSIVSVSITRVK